LTKSGALDWEKIEQFFEHLAAYERVPLSRRSLCFPRKKFPPSFQEQFTMHFSSLEDDESDLEIFDARGKRRLRRRRRRNKKQPRPVLPTFFRLSDDESEEVLMVVLAS
jgi:hypothetical protein